MIGLRATVLAVGFGSAHLALAALPGDVNRPSAIVPPEGVEPIVVQPATPARALETTDTDFSDVRIAAQQADDAVDAREAECMAKVIVHEAGNQPRVGQVAVAQVIRTRVRSGRFADTVCGVVKQRGQFFNVDAYNPPRSGARWATAMAVATETLDGVRDAEVAPGALFFQSAGGVMRSRVRVAQIADHIFYR